MCVRACVPVCVAAVAAADGRVSGCPDAKLDDAIEHTPSKPEGFLFTQSDVARYGMSVICLGCKFVTGIVDSQHGHNAACRKRILELMKEDPEDKHRGEY